MFAPSLQFDIMGLSPVPAVPETDPKQTSSPRTGNQGRKVIRRVSKTRGPNGRIAGVKSVTPHTLATSDTFLFVLGRSAGANYIVRVPVAALRKLIGLPGNFHIEAGVLDIDPQTTEFDYAGRYPKFFEGDDVESAEE